VHENILSYYTKHITKNQVKIIKRKGFSMDTPESPAFC